MRSVGSTDTLNFVVNSNLNAMRITATGAIGILKNAPNFALDVNGTGSFYGVRISS